MSVRLTGALVAALALLIVQPAVAAGQLSRDAQKVYDDYRADAAIAPCDHSIKTYRRTLREITPAIEEQSPAFRPAVEAALSERERGRGKSACVGPSESAQTPGNPNAPAAGQPAPPAAGKPVPQPAVPQPQPQPQPASPAPAAPPTSSQPSTRAPAASPTPSPTATVAPAPPVTSSAPAPATGPVLVDRPHEGTPTGLLIALGLLALSLLLALAALALRDSERFAGARHAWGEAAYRAGGTWDDFRDWVRAGH